MRWMVILLAATPLAYGAEPSEVEKPATDEPVAAETAEPAPDPNFVSEEEAEVFKALGHRQLMSEGEMKWCRREGESITGSRLKVRICRTAQEVRALGETPRDATKSRTRGAE